jgi:RNA polymerase sigma factor (sigma-70 family)
MSELSDADRYLVEQIRAGDQDGWTQLVSRYQGRLCAFARKQLKEQDAEDAVQETFISFLKGINSFEDRSSLETFLFTILRRRIVDVLRQKGRIVDSKTCELSRDDAGQDPLEQIPQTDITSASVYLQHNETVAQQRDALRVALGRAIVNLQSDLRFRDLQLIEMIFYAQMRNNRIAELLSISEQQVALLKHRFVKRVAKSIHEERADGSPDGQVITESEPPEHLLIEVWELVRPTCPKRSTLGKYTLRTLEADWMDHIQFHVDQLGCRLCRANLDDMHQQIDDEAAKSFSDRVMQSSIGFFR